MESETLKLALNAEKWRTLPVDWKKFEEMVKEVFEANGFETRKNFRFKHSSEKFEVDLVAFNSFFLVVVECKRWSGGRYKKSQLVREAAKHSKRADKLLEEFPELGKGRKVLKVVVTAMEEDLVKEKDVLFVSLYKLNRFLTEEIFQFI